MGVPGFGRGDADKWARHVPAFFAQARPLEEARRGEARPGKRGAWARGRGNRGGSRGPERSDVLAPRARARPATGPRLAGWRASRRGRPSAPPRAPQDLEEKERERETHDFWGAGVPFLVPDCAPGIRETQHRLLCRRVASDRGCVTGESLWGSPRSAVLGGNQGQTPRQQAGHLGVCVSRAPSLKSKACKTGQKRGVRGTNIPLSKEAGCELGDPTSEHPYSVLPTPPRSTASFLRGIC